MSAKKIKALVREAAIALIRMDRSGRLEAMALQLALRIRPDNVRYLTRWASFCEERGRHQEAYRAWRKLAGIARFKSISAYEMARQKIADKRVAEGTVGDDDDGSFSTQAFAAHIDRTYLRDPRGDVGKAELSGLLDRLIGFMEGSESVSDVAAYLQGAGSDRPQSAKIIPDALGNILKACEIFLFCSGRIDYAAQLAEMALHLQPDSAIHLRILAQSASQSGDWEQAVRYWQYLAAVQNPVKTKNNAVVPRNPAMQARVTRFALTQLRLARTQLALQSLDKGETNKATELLCRVVESTSDQRILKTDPDLVRLVARHVGLRLASDRPEGVTFRADKVRRLVICLDVLKISNVHTHSRFILSIARSLLDTFEDISIHLVVTNERFVVTTPYLSDSSYPSNESTFRALARSVLPDHLDQRFFIAYFESRGLEGLANTCRDILALRPDVILYGGGHRGLFSNESRLVRHSLFPFVPTAFFFIQANNEVDEKIDMVIARGPHAITGPALPENIRVQPYPTMVGHIARETEGRSRSSSAGMSIVSAVAGVRLSLKLKAMGNQTLRALLSILDNNPRAVWHFIGSNDPKALIAGIPEIAERVKRGQVQIHPVLSLDDFTDFVARADLFLHLPGFTGGSGGAGIARRKGVPILTFSNSDVAGRQPEETVFEETGIADYCAMASRILQDPDFSRHITERQFATSDQIYTTAAEGFYNCLNEAVTVFGKRHGARKTMLSAAGPRRS